MIKRRHVKCFSAVAGISALAGVASAQTTSPLPPPCTQSDGFGNTGCGTGVLYSSYGGYNSAFGLDALAGNKGGAFNTAVGEYALRSNVNGSYNTAIGDNTLQTTAANQKYNVAVGSLALSHNYNAANKTSSNYNVAVGAGALFSLTTPALKGYNTGIGYSALAGNGTGGLAGTDNTGDGAFALANTTTGVDNTAAGFAALYSNSTGSNNTASGYEALYNNTTGTYATALGYYSLSNSQSGLGNIGVGPFAGRNIVQGQLNIDIGSWGSADESNTIRIGIPQYHRTTYVAGIGNSAIPGGTPVVVNPTTGQLGYAGSSERYKRDITPLGFSTERLAQLRPVSFHIKTDPSGAIQYGLIAEEVDRVYPELVIRDSEGNIQGVRYDELTPMLLNEVQRENEHTQAQDATIAAQAAQIASLEQKLADIQLALIKLQPADKARANP